MVTDFSSQRFILLDACCVLNLYATRRIREILEAIPVRFAVAERAAAEALFVRRGGSGDDASEQDPVNLQPLVTGGLLEILHLETETEMASFVQFAAELDDGEAMTCALAVHRSATVATDDRKARKVLNARAPGVHIHSTAEIIKRWAEAKQVPEPSLKRVLADVLERARFTPSRHDPLQAWWEETICDP